MFDPARIQSRLERAQKAFENGHYQCAQEIVSELEAEGNTDSAMTLLKANIEQAMRQETISQLLESAKARFEEDEDPLALETIQQILELDANHAAALGLKSRIENRRSERQIDGWIRLADEHVANYAYGYAREALESVLRIRPMDTRASKLLVEVETSEQEYLKLRAEKAEIYQSAFNHWKNGEVSKALSQMGLVLELDRRAPDSSSAEVGQTYQSFYNTVRSEHDALNNAYAEALRAIAQEDFDKALAACDVYLTTYPSNALFQALKFDIEERSRQRLSAFIAPIDRQLEAEPGLETKLELLPGALLRYPEESHFERSLKLVTDTVNSTVLRARQHEERGELNEALGDLEFLRTIYSLYPGLAFEIERLEKKREERAREAAKAGWIKRINCSLGLGEYSVSLELVAEAQQEFAGDAELAELEKAIFAKRVRAEQVEQLVAAGRDLCALGSFDEGLTSLRQALDLDERNSAARNALVEALVAAAQMAISDDCRRAESLVENALDLDPFHALAQNLRSEISDRKKSKEVEQLLSQARKLHGEGDLDGAMAEVKKALSECPSEPRIDALRETLEREIAQSGRRRVLLSDLGEIKTPSLRARAALARELAIYEPRRAVTVPYPGETKFQPVASEVDKVARERAIRTIPKQELARARKPWVLPAIPKKALWLSGAVLVLVVVLLTTHHRGSKPAVTGPRPVSFSTSLTPIRTEEAASTARSSEQRSTQTRTVGSRPPARLEMHDLEPGSEVIIDGKTVGKANRRGAFSSNVPVGDHQIKLLPRNQQLRVIWRNFRDGSAVPLSGKDFEDKGSLAALDTSPVALDLGDQAAWQQVKDSSTISDLERFVAEYPNTSHRPEAESRLEDLYWSGANNGSISGYRDYLDRYPNGKYSQSARYGIAKLDFEAVMSSRDTLVLQDFLSRNPSGEYHDRIAERLDDLTWSNTASSDGAALNTYLSRFPGGRHADQARTEIAALTPASVPDAPQTKVERTISAAVDDKSAVLRLVRQYQQAYQSESVDQLKTLWPNMSEQQIRALNDFFGHVRRIKLDCTLNGNPTIAGNDATLKFTQTLSYVNNAQGSTVSSKLIMHLRKESSGSGMSDWRIESIR